MCSKDFEDYKPKYISGLIFKKIASIQYKFNYKLMERREISSDLKRKENLPVKLLLLVKQKYLLVNLKSGVARLKGNKTLSECFDAVV